MNTLPVEVKLDCMKYFTASDLVGLMKVNREWWRIATDRSVWRMGCRTIFGLQTGGDYVSFGNISRVNLLIYSKHHRGYFYYVDNQSNRRTIVCSLVKRALVVCAEFTVDRRQTTANLTALRILFETDPTILSVLPPDVYDYVINNDSMDIDSDIYRKFEPFIRRLEDGFLVVFNKELDSVGQWEYSYGNYRVARVSLSDLVKGWHWEDT